MKRLFPCLALLLLAGCEPYRPPANPQLIQQRTASGPVYTKLEARPQPYPPAAGQVSIWDLKVFDRKDKSNGLRQEWKFFAQLPQQAGTPINNTQVLMNAWIISPDNTIFLPQKPTAKDYGSFVTDWTIPRPGAYTLWVEYRPAIGEESLSLQEVLTRKASQNLPREVAHWDFTATGQAVPAIKSDASNSVPSSSGIALKTYDDKGERVAETVTLQSPSARVGQKTALQWALSAGSAPIENPEIVAIAPDRSTLLHAIGQAPALTFDQPGKWRVWFSFTCNGQSFAAPYSLTVAP